MKNIEILYSCNVTVSPEKYDSQIELIPHVLEQQLENLNKHEIKTVFFVDTILFLQLQEKSPDIFSKAKKVLQDISSAGHNIEMLINTVWETSDDLHHLDIDDLTDMFARGKYLLYELHDNKKQSQIFAVRVLNAKIQPFAYLQEAYTLSGAKIDASIFPKIKSSLYFNFSSIKHGDPVRFSDDPNQPDRFGKYLGLPRAVFDYNFSTRLSIKKELNKIFSQDPEQLVSLLDNTKVKPHMINLPIAGYKNTKMLSPDVIPPLCFQKIMEKQVSIIKNLCVLESSLEDICPLTFKNIEYISSSNIFQNRTLSEIVQKYSTTYQKHFKR